MLQTSKTPESMKVCTADNEYLRRVVSKLWLGGSRWEISWSENEVAINSKEDQTTCIARQLTSPTFQLALKTIAPQFDSHPAWNVWKDDARFKDYLLTDDLYEGIKNEIYHSLEQGTFDVEKWMETSVELKKFVSDLEKELDEGFIADKLVSEGWN